ncbi:uncharacterized protein RBU57_009245 isoform 1-T2 [Macrochelys suwanniensis]
MLKPLPFTLPLLPLNLELCKKLGIQCNFTIPYHPQNIGLAENISKSIKRALCKLVDDSATNWDNFLVTYFLSEQNRTQQPNCHPINYCMALRQDSQTKSQTTTCQQISMNSMTDTT